MVPNDVMSAQGLEFYISQVTDQDNIQIFQILVWTLADTWILISRPCDVCYIYINLEIGPYPTAISYSNLTLKYLVISYCV